MKKIIKYTIFNTNWGYFGMAGDKNCLLQTLLPAPNRCKIEQNLLKNHPDATFDKNFSRNLQNQITAYFEGTYITFNKDIHIDFDRFTLFAKKVLTVCRDIAFGQTATYGQLAKKAGFPAAGRAVGRILAKNPTPLIIPCHRIILSDGQLGGFTATGGTATKRKLLQLECSV